MPLRPSYCRRTLHDALHRPTRTVPTPALSSPSYIWISDDMIADTFNQFSKTTVTCLGCKRHGSNVPGPLEANRRLSKRRMAGHVVARQGQPGTTATGLADLLAFGQQQQQQQQGRVNVGNIIWEAPALASGRKKVESGPEPTSLPPWLAALESCKNSYDASIVNASAAQSDFKHSTRLIGCKTDMRALWRNEKYSGIEPSWKSRALFRCFLENNSKYLLRIFLEDAELSSPVIENLGKILSEYQENEIDYRVIRLLTSVIQKSLGLNLISCWQIKLLLSNLQELIAKVQDIPHSKQETILNIYYQLWRGVLKGASTRSSKPLNEHCRILLHQIQDLSYSKLLISFRCDLLLSLSGSRYQVLGNESASDLLALLALTSFEITRSAKSSDHGNELFNELVGVLNIMPKQEACQIVQSVTERLLSSDGYWSILDINNRPNIDQFTSIRYHNINEWLQCVQRCVHFHGGKGLNDTVWQNLYWTILSQVKPSTVGSFLNQNFTDLEIALIIFRTRIRSLLTKRLRSSRSVSRAYRQVEQILQNEISDALSSFPILGVQPYVLISSALFACSLPRQKVEEEIIHFIFHTKGFSAVKQYIISMRKHDLFVHPHTLRNVIMNLMSIHPESAVRISLLSEYLNLPHFPDLPVVAAGKGAVSPDEAFKLLKRVYSNNQDNCSNSAPMTRTDIIEEKADVLHQMATAFAYNQCLTAGRAFRAVYRCYRHLCTLQVAPGPAIAKALVHAGVIRFLKRNRWVSTMKLRWILSIVKASENKETANRIDQIVWIWRGRVIERWRVKAATRRKMWR